MPVENLVLPKKLEDGHDIKLARQAFGEDNNITFEDVLAKFGLMRSANNCDAQPDTAKIQGIV